MSWNFLKTSWKRLEDVFWGRMSKANIFVLIKTSWRRLQDVFWTRRRKISSRRLHRDKCLQGFLLWFILSFIIQSRSIIFVFYYILMFNFFFFVCYFFICPICICFCWIEWLYFLSSLTLRSILLTSSVNTLYFSLLNLFCCFNINLLFLMNSLWCSWRLLTSSLFFASWLISFWSNLQIYVFFLLHTFFVPFLWLNIANSVIIFPPLSFFINPLTFFVWWWSA